MRGTKLALLAQNGPIWRVLTAHGELSTAVTTNKPRRANFFTLTHTRPSRRIPLASSAAFEARHTATDLYTPIMAAPLISREDQHTAADLCTHDPAIVVDTGDHRQDRIERKNAHA